MDYGGWIITQRLGCFSEQVSRGDRLYLLAEQRGPSELGDSASSRSWAVGPCYLFRGVCIMHARSERSSRVLVSVVEYYVVQSHV
jgi:hypothetical protein